MHRVTTASCVTAIVALATSNTSLAGPDWCEENLGDAPSGGTFGVQTPVGFGPLAKIKGELEGELGGGLGPAGDYEDVYRIFIKDPVNFSATVNADATAFDTQLFLFDEFGNGLLANDEIPGAVDISGFGNASDDGTGIVITAPGFYLLAISTGLGDTTALQSDPIDATGALLFDQALRTEVSGPDGPGLELFDWTPANPDEIGTYEIDLTGASFVPAPGAAALAVAAGLVTGLRRRR